MVISGTLTDGINGGGLSNATVVLSYQKIEGNIASTAYKTLATNVTPASGYYAFVFQKPNAIRYKIQITRTDYFSITEEINPDNLTTEHDNIKNYTLYPSATFTIHLDNVNPVDSDDHVLFQNLNEMSTCPSCCNNALKVLDGMNVDTSFTCTKYGNTYVKFQWVVTKNAVTNIFQDSIYCPTGQITTYQINY